MASTIFELFGYPVDDWSDEAWQNLSECKCPFTGEVCDGGGNRFSSKLSLSSLPQLKPFFKDQTDIVPGICSFRLHENEQPWIVCPRRLLNYREGNNALLQEAVKKQIEESVELMKGERFRVWNETKFKSTVTSGDKELLFDYTFDYIVAGERRMRISAVAEMLKVSEDEARDIAEKAGLTLCARADGLYCEDFPSDPLVIIEIMTSSTSGGNKRKRLTVGQVFEDTILSLAGKDVVPGGPGINYRQVWARMVSQLLVKSQIGRAWGGLTFWVIQDVLGEYISKTTALDLAKYLSSIPNEVNVVTAGYGKNAVKSGRTSKFATLDDVKMHSGPVSAGSYRNGGFVDIVKLGCTPDVSELWKQLLAKKPCLTFIA